MHTRRITALLGAGALTASGLIALPGLPAVAADGPYSLAGDLQSEISTCADWDEKCTATELTETSEGIYEFTATVPAGSWEYKIVGGHSWNNSWGNGDANMPITVAGDTQVTFQFNATTNKVGVALDLGDTSYTPADDAIIAAPASRGSGENFYFVLTDRFANGDSSNDTGGLDSDPLVSGYDPTNKGFYQGGDIAGLRERLDYIESLGTTAIWLTPSFKNQPVQGSGSDASAGYHGYWVTDFTQLDPHLGTNDEFKAFIEDAHSRGIKVYFDIIVNHTADLIEYEGDSTSYVSLADSPYKDAAGQTFDPAAIAGTTFPELDAATSFPYVPQRQGDVVPAELNDVTLYHNRGNSTWSGESVTYGDFDGLDDLMTENPVVEQTFEEVYKAWMDFGIDGFRIDTAKHVNFQFWKDWTAGISEYAEATNPDFFTFGEVYDNAATDRAPYVRQTDMGATLDFGFQDSVKNYASGYTAQSLAGTFAADDYFTTATSNAGDMPTFLGNHDMGRIGYLLNSAGADQPETRSVLAHEIMFLTRGQPVVYYGDEQGFAGTGNDKDARQSLFASQTAEYRNQQLLDGSTFGAGDHYDQTTTLYTTISEVATLRSSTPALRVGAQIELYAEKGPGVYAFSRVDRDEKIEYVVAVNNATSASTATFTTLTPGASYTGVYGTDDSLTADAAGQVTVAVAPLSAVVFRADRQVAAADQQGVVVTPTAGEALTVQATTLAGQNVSESLVPVTATVQDDHWAETTFAYRLVGTNEWTSLGTATGDSPRVFHDVSGLKEGTLIEYRAISVDAEGKVAANTGFGSLGVNQSIGAQDSGNDNTTGMVSIPGTHQLALGCTGNWQPACDQTQLTAVAGTDWYSGTFTLPAGNYEYKIALGGSWDVNFGAGAVPNGANVAYTVAAEGPVTFYYNAKTHEFFNTAEHPPYTVPGNFNAAVGCAQDWDPACLATLMTDPDGDGIFTFSTTRLPATPIEAKVSESLSWDVAYGRDGNGAGGSPNYQFDAVPAGKLAVFTYNPSTHILTLEVTDIPVVGDGQAIGYWLDEETLAWPADVATDGATYTLYYAKNGGITRQGADVSGADGSVALQVKAGGLTSEQKEQDPYLTAKYTSARKDYVALTPEEPLDRDLIETILTGEIEVLQADANGNPVAFTSLQTARVLDALYAQKAAQREQGVSFQGKTPTLSLWAPTAQSVTLRLYDDLSAEGEPQELPMERQSDGSWTITGEASWANRAYLYDVEVYVPPTAITAGDEAQEAIAGTVVHNIVTDPNSVGLTTDSKQSVIVNLDDPEAMPEVWSDTASPVIAQFSDRAILEMHVRDFSIADETVPEALRGTYGAFGVSDSDGMKELRELSDAGMNTIHLLPTYDIASIPEDRSAQEIPQVPEAAADSSEQQEAVMAVADQDGYNWGYDPFHYTTPEGSYASDGNQDGAARTAEYRSMVGHLHAAGYQVVLDEVFNHTYACGQDETSVFEKIVPGYYHRLGYAGQTLNSPCCAEYATEHAMAEDLMIDSLVTWAKEYKVDGFRFDLMEFNSVQSMQKIRAALDELTLAEDGVDGKSMYLYGEGWAFGTTADGSRFEPSIQGRLGGTGIGTFNDRLRDAVHGAQSDGKNDTQGFGNGLYTDPNGIAGGDADQLRFYTDTIRIGLAGNLSDFTITAADGTEKTGAEITFNGASVGYATQPYESVNYVDAHDNETLYDLNVWKMPMGSSMEDRVRMNTLSLATVTLGQSPVFWHGGTDLLRSKSLDRNSYNSGDWFNAIDWSGQTSNFGVGLPPARDNSPRWDAMRPYLSNANLVPDAAAMTASHEQALDLLRLRSSSELFTLDDADLIKEKVSFPNAGPNATPGLLVMRIDDTAGADIDPERDGLLVVFNASPNAITEAINGMEGTDLTLSQIQQDGGDEVVKQTVWDNGTVTIPGRTVAVLEQKQTVNGCEAEGNCTFFLSSEDLSITDIMFHFVEDGTPIAGDWDGDGSDEVGFRIAGSNEFVLRGDDGELTRFRFGRSGDDVLVGDWNGDGRDTISVRRGATIYINNALSGGAAEQSFIFGRTSDEILAGDWDGDGKDTVAVRRANAFYLRNSLQGGNADWSYHYGRAADEVLVGNWDGASDGPWVADTVALRRGNQYYIANSADGGPADDVVVYGEPSDTPLAGDWNGNGTDTLGVYRK
ncbi:pullulanase-type alpha-1,6-glucosidase [Actinobaculum sp. 352]|uniref:pullulanase-type alpha-1,6-glucosidase n=1 Tax=Actinobaculum sp. 352 TaxID=2490946 RepID=UPI000F7F88B2|nr:pullulanase-type alpha-1,6-glucosidase [Actinobaculum sp. 352]RTE50681.1 pullulanase-type alpha-1,6-glucosidase [Actinobaculum sp. 352]